MIDWDDLMSFIAVSSPSRGTGILFFSIGKLIIIIFTLNQYYVDYNDDVVRKGVTAFGILISIAIITIVCLIQSTI